MTRHVTSGNEEKRPVPVEGEGGVEGKKKKEQDRNGRHVRRKRGERSEGKKGATFEHSDKDYVHARPLSIVSHRMDRR